MNSIPGNAWDKLQQAGIVSGESPGTVILESPWYVKLLLAISGWLAALFLLGFLGFGFKFIFESAGASLFFGSMMIAGAFALLRFPKNEFYEHIALAVSLAGQALIIFSIFDNLDKEIAWFLASCFQLALAIVMPNFIHRVFSSFFTAFCFSMALGRWGAPYVSSSIIMFAVAWLWLHEFSYPKQMSRLRAIGYGSVLALIQVKGTALFNFSVTGWYTTKADMSLWAKPWMGEVLAGAVTIYVVWSILKRLGHGLSEPVAMFTLVATVILTAVSVEARGITVGMLILILGFAGSNRVLMGLGILSLLFYISSYYYLLDTTLLIKSQTLLVVGVVLLGARWLLLRVVSQQKEGSHD